MSAHGSDVGLNGQVRGCGGTPFTRVLSSMACLLVQSNPRVHGSLPPHAGSTSPVMCLRMHADHAQTSPAPNAHAQLDLPPAVTFPPAPEGITPVTDVLGVTPGGGAGEAEVMVLDATQALEEANVVVGGPWGWVGRSARVLSALGGAGAVHAAAQV